MQKEPKLILNKPQTEVGKKGQTGWQAGELSSFHLCLSLQQWEPSSPSQGGILLKVPSMTHGKEEGPRNGDTDCLGPPG